MKIKELCEAERPREKMLSKGAGALGDGELLAVILRSGTAGKGALDLAQNLLKSCNGSLCTLANMSSRKLCSFPGIKAQKASSIIAALELGRRMMIESGSFEKKPLVTAKDAYKMMLPHLKGLLHEECWVMFLNRANYVLECCRMSQGGDFQTIIDTKEIVRGCLDRHACALILVHNHPSGNPRPSKADIEQTDALHDALNSFGIDLLDHIIVCDDCFFSFSDS